MGDAVNAARASAKLPAASSPERTSRCVPTATQPALLEPGSRCRALSWRPGRSAASLGGAVAAEGISSGVVGAAEEGLAEEVDVAVPELGAAVGVASSPPPDVQAPVARTTHTAGTPHQALRRA
ncbi:hypothetical protein PDTK01_32260 [Phycicoccus sp. DTK01]|nr:hypothetical protein PDTK01_32260 [Phycicoccus sp. DTK01]